MSRRRKPPRPAVLDLEVALFEMNQLVEMAWELAPPESPYCPPWLGLIGGPMRRAREAFDRMSKERTSKGPAYTSCAVQKAEAGGGPL